jgi:hypothetical protein
MNAIIDEPCVKPLAAGVEPELSRGLEVSFGLAGVAVENGTRRGPFAVTWLSAFQGKSGRCGMRSFTKAKRRALKKMMVGKSVARRSQPSPDGQ